VNDIFLLVYGFARAAWRRRKLAMLAAWAVALAIWMVTLGLKDRYQASARVLVDVRTPLQQVIKGMSIESDYTAQLARVRELLLSRPQIEAVARKTNLDKDVGSDPAKMDALVSKLGKEIIVFATAAGGVPAGGNTNTAATDSVYNIIYQHNDRDKSVEVVRELLSSFEAGTTLGNRDGANEAQKFLDERIEEAKKKLKEQEDLIAEFQKRNLNVLPGQKGDYFVRFAQEQTGLQQAETNRAVALGRQNALNTQLANTPKYLAGSSAGGAPDVTMRRQEAEKKLEEMLLVYTDKNPDVVRLKETIDDLRKREATELASLQSGGEGSGDTSKTINPNWQQISAALSQLQGDIAAINAAAAQHKREISRLEGQLDQTPAIQQEYLQLTRNYATDTLQYEQLLQKKQQAEISDDAAESGIARFDVLDPPRADPAPVWPSRPLFILGGLVAALGAGVVLALLPHLLAPTVNDMAALERQFGLPVLGTVSALRDASVEHRERYAIRNTVFGVGALVVFAAFLVVFSDTIAAAIRH
jgi:polysaccharide chain length determinant protein (PEP-CTERM system associated)